MYRRQLVRLPGRRYLLEVALTAGVTGHAAPLMTCLKIYNTAQKKPREIVYVDVLEVISNSSDDEQVWSHSS
jgi:hypothetical protein